MRYNKFQLGALLLLGTGLSGLQAQTMYLRQINGAQTAYSLNNVKKLTFPGGNVAVQKNDNSINTYALSGLRYLNFSNLALGITEQPTHIKNAQLLSYPNPITDFLYIDLTGEPCAGTLSILTLEGKVMQTQQTSGGSLAAINLSYLPQGIYLCSFSYTSEIKTVKIIKR